ncbi:response regulator [Spirosoma areae]
MNKNGPVIVIEDDHDDQYLLSEVFKKLGYTNEVLYFFDGQHALDYLQDTTVSPFLILSDINIPRLDGFVLKDKYRLMRPYKSGVFLICYFPRLSARKWLLMPTVCRLRDFLSSRTQWLS